MDKTARREPGGKENRMYPEQAEQLFKMLSSIYEVLERIAIFMESQARKEAELAIARQKAYEPIKD